MLWFKHQQGICSVEVTAKIGEPIKGKFINTDTIKMVVVDGQEAEQALKMINKHTDKRPVKFFGDDARFIVANWY